MQNSKMSTPYFVRCHDDELAKTTIEPAENAVKSFYQRPTLDMQLENKKTLPDIEWSEPYNEVFSHLVFKETSVDDKASAYLHADLGTDPDCIKSNEGLNNNYRNLCHKLGAFASNNFLRSVRTKAVVLNYCGIDSVDFYTICQSLYEHRLVTTLDVAENNIGPQGAYYLSQLLLENEFHKIRVDSNNIGDFGCNSILASVLFSEVVYLSLSNNKITDKCIGPLNELLKVEKSKVKDLFLDHNLIGQSLSKSAKDFRALFANNVSLDNVNLSYNNINREQAIGIFVGLKNNNTVSILDLAHNGIENDVCKSIGTCLKQNHSLQYLDLSGNFISIDGVKQIVLGLKHNDCLNTLKMGKNPINITAAFALLNATNNDKSAIYCLHLDHVEVPPEFVRLLTEMRKSREMDVRYVLGPTPLHKFEPEEVKKK